jgi:hypothetical protein
MLNWRFAIYNKLNIKLSMAIESTQEVDAIGIDEKSGEVVLTLIDSTDWGDPSEHMFLLQEKLNAFLGFIESCELASAYPDSSGRACRIDLLLRYDPVQAALGFFAKVAAVTLQCGATFRWEVIDV